MVVLGLLAACSSEGPTEDDGRMDLAFSFEEGTQDWTGDFVDFGLEMKEEDLELVFDLRALPEEVGGSGRALVLEGLNLSDDLFMFLKHQVTGLRVNTTYAVTFDLDLASNAPSGCAGIGGAPGESVYLKVGVARTEPKRVVVDDSFRLSVDKGNQSQDGANALVIGTIANGEPCTGEAPFRRITRDNQATPFLFPTGSDGTLWLFVGTDSGFEGKTTLFYDAIRVLLEPR